MKKNISFIKIFFIAFLISSLGIIVDKSSAQSNSGLKFEISFPSKAHPEHIKGRVYVIISRNGRREPRLQRMPTDVLIWGKEISSLKPGEAVIIDDNVFGFPLKSIRNIPPGDYYVQGFINIYTDRWLYHTLRKYVRINKKCRMEPLPEDYEDALDENHRAGHSLRFYEKMGRHDDLFENTTPEDLFEAKELWELIVDIVGFNDSLVLIGVRDRKTEAEEQGLDYYTYCQRLYRKKRSLKKILLALGYPI